MKIGSKVIFKKDCPTYVSMEGVFTISKIVNNKWCYFKESAGSFSIDFLEENSDKTPRKKSEDKK